MVGCHKKSGQLSQSVRGAMTSASVSSESLCRLNGPNSSSLDIGSGGSSVSSTSSTTASLFVEIIILRSDGKSALKVESRD
ncbi:hypothetical protein L1987_43752 [Smallanthus sonchifolius]|uniref:Uncharacterized protein n=1 Tax=Smallanthus sonchifolius TaxID=185202 RepID=A0ACB9GMD1_9ASTR|nr:hypothetical protein L1987_43752 [Smallanthus sonchifolius]